jgi:hypothetical protein
MQRLARASVAQRAAVGIAHQKFGFRAIALRTLEQTVGAVLRASVRPRAPNPREARWRELMGELAEAGRTAYRAGAPPAGPKASCSARWSRRSMASRAAFRTPVEAAGVVPPGLSWVA